MSIDPSRIAAAPGSGAGAAILDPAVPSRRRARVLFINDTARNGGPARSLYYVLKFLDPAVVHRSVVLPREGVISELYGDRGITEELFFEQNLVENPIEPWSRAMTRGDFDAPLHLRAARLVGNVGKGAWAIARLTSIIQRAQYDLIYCNGTNANFAGGVLSRTARVPALWHVRYTSIPSALRPLHDRLSASAGVRRILCVSQASAALFPKASTKVRVLHNALDIAEFDVAHIRPRLRQELHLGPGVVIFGSQGRILPRKGYVEMVRAAKRALDQMTLEEQARCHFAVLGDTPEDVRPDHLAECRALAAGLGIDKKFSFLGFRVDVKPYVVDFNVAVVPSIYSDPLPRAVIESMALRKPVIAFDAGGVGEMVCGGNEGALVCGTPPDIDALSSQFLLYLRDPELRQSQGRAARQRVERDFDSRAQARKIQNEIVIAAGLGR